MQDPHGVSELIRAAKPSVEEGEALKAMRIKVRAAAWQLLDQTMRAASLPWAAQRGERWNCGRSVGRGGEPFFTNVANALGFGRGMGVRSDVDVSR